jgi:hypothetical protein
MEKVQLLKKRKLYNFQIAPTKTHENGFNDGMKKFDELGDAFNIGFIPKSSYDKGLIEGFLHQRNQFMEYMDGNSTIQKIYK